MTTVLSAEDRAALVPVAASSVTPCLDGLLVQQRNFVWQYLVDQNATAAAIRAGYSKRSAGSIAHAMLKKTHITAAIAEARTLSAQRAEVTTADVLKEFSHLAFSDVGEIMDGKLSENAMTFRDLQDMSPGQRAAISSVKLVTTPAGEQTIEVRFHSKLGALDSLAKVLGMFEKVQKHEHTVIPMFGAANFGPEGQQRRPLPGGGGDNTAPTDDGRGVRA